MIMQLLWCCLFPYSQHHLNIADTSPKPHGLNATGVGSTWVMLEWFVPAPFRSITFHASFRFYNYIVLAVDHTSMGGVTVSAPLRYAVGDRHPRFNVTHLSPSTTYKIVVTTRVDKIRIAMERQDELGYFSDPITVTTLAHLQPGMFTYSSYHYMQLQDLDILCSICK